MIDLWEDSVEVVFGGLTSFSDAPMQAVAGDLNCSDEVSSSLCDI